MDIEGAIQQVESALYYLEHLELDYKSAVGPRRANGKLPDDVKASAAHLVPIAIEAAVQLLGTLDTIKK